jgi:predicted flap endonuclease-1-like 5' DNA nuclease
VLAVTAGLAGALPEQERQMTQRGGPQSSSTERSGDNFRKIDGIGPVLERRLWGAGILTYSDLGQRTPEEIAAILPPTAGISAERIASQNWTGQARELAESPPEASVPHQHYAAFHVEFLLESDNSVRGTRVHHHQTDARDAWAGWDEEKLLTFLRNRIPLPAAATPANAPSGVSAQTQTDEPAQTQTDEPAQTQTTDQDQASVEPAPARRVSARAPDWLPSWSLNIEELAPIRDGQPSYTLSPNEPSSVRLTMRINPAGTTIHDTFDFAATIVARRFGGHDRSLLGTIQETIRGSDPVSVEVTGPTLPTDVYRLVVTVDIYPAGHSPEEPPLYSKPATGDFMRVADAPLGSAPAIA